MKKNCRTACDQDILLEDFVADLTCAAYAVALRHGRGDLWLDLEFELWRVLTDTLQKWGRGSPPRLVEEAFVSDWAGGQSGSVHDGFRDGPSDSERSYR